MPKSKLPKNEISLKALKSVFKERAKQDKQWGGPSHDDEHDTDDWLTYIEYQIKKLGITSANPKKDRKRFVKIAALAIAAIESMDRTTTWHK